MMASKTGYLRYADKDLDEESWKIAKHELGETEENKKKCLDILKKKILEKEDLKANLNDSFLLAFLRVAKYDCKKAYQRLIRFYEDRLDMPEVFNEYSPSSVEIVRTVRQLYIAPYRSKQDNSGIIIWKRGLYDPAKHSYELVIRYLCMFVDVALLEKLNQICGITLVVDFKTSAWTSWNELTPSRLKLWARLMQKSLPLRVRCIHVVNASAFYYLVYSMIYPFLSLKMRNRVQLHKNYASLHACIDREILPMEYEGHLEQSELTEAYKTLRENDEFFDEISKYGFLKKKK